jgi:hypothetical protein
MLQIDPIVFLMQVAGLFAWICLVAAIYTLVERMLGRSGGKPEEPTKV